MATLTGTTGDDSLVGGTGDITILGLDGNDTILVGATGENNTIDGGLGIDQMRGNDGDDVYLVDNAADQIVEFAGLGSGIDSVQSSVSYSLSVNVENLLITGSAVFGIGNDSVNILTGNSTDNTLDGKLGADTMIGAGGNDVFYVDDANDIVNVLAGSATDIDTVFSSVDYVLTSPQVVGTATSTVENVTLLGTAALIATGNALTNVLIGNDGNNILDGGTTGNATSLAAGIGDDTLDGGVGADTMIGGDGNDTYYIDNIGDQVIETGLSGNGFDTVYVNRTYTLLDDFEILRLTGTAAINGTGNNYSNSIYGNAAVNTLTGLDGDDNLDGKGGADTLVGGDGNDIYFLDNVADRVIENAGGAAGTNDTILVTLPSGTFDMSTRGQNVENIFLGGTAASNVIGNDLNNRIVGNSADNTIDGGVGADTMSGGGGNDTYIVDDGGDIVDEVAGQGIDTVRSAITFTLTTTTENLVLTGTANLDGFGNALGNVITGNAGNNTLDGDTGADALSGLAGNDTYFVDNAGDTVMEAAGQGTDTVFSSVSFTLGANVENLVLAAGTFPLTGTGNASANTITGNDGNNTLDGGTGADRLIGGLGDDTYVVDNTGDVVVENGGTTEGIDTIQASATFSLLTNGTNVENLTLIGTAAINGTGDNGDNVIIGNSSANQLVGMGGNDTLDGGAGSDRLLGGLGNDIYFVDASSDVVIENAGEGTDTVYAAASYTLSANIENLILNGFGSINGTGNALDNTITGNDGANTLDGAGGSDVLIGGTGNDTYIVDTLAAGPILGDQITENSGEGTDTVLARVNNYALAANVENLTLDTGIVHGTGNALDNIITGNNSVNSLDGGAGNDTLDGLAGADMMAGGTGDDTYYVDNSTDSVTELGSEGTDMVISSVSYVLGDYTTNGEVENLTLTGTANLTATGNAGDNILTGNSGNNVIIDGVGAGIGGFDTLVGGIGNDTYFVNATTDLIVENAGEGTDTVHATASYTLGNEVEILILDGAGNIDGTGNNGNNTLTGNSGDNTLDGGTGNDTLIGTAGNDTLIGGLGDDLYILGSTATNTIIVEGVSGGNDTVQSDVNVILAPGGNVENIILSGTTAVTAIGDNGDNFITGNSIANTLDGAGGNDTLNGGAGNDTLIGGLGNDTLIGSTGTDDMNGGDGSDTYYVDVAGDAIHDDGAGIGDSDTVYAGITYTLSPSSGIENLTLTGTGAINGTGDAGANTITGNSGVNILTGGAGNDTLDGGIGADKLVGGLGNDTFVVDNIKDTATESAGEGTDTVLSTVAFTLGANIENLVITGTSSVSGTGNGDVNIITGNSGDNTLDGKAGADTMIGGAGNDTYIVDNAGDVITENLNEGTDTIVASTSFNLSLPAYANIENLTLTGTGNINGIGNDNDNTFVGNSGVNTFTGGLGNDTYYVTSNDIIIENASEGTDTAYVTLTSGSYTLPTNVEFVILTGTNAVNITGNAFDNNLTGNGGNNTLDGGIGADTLTGGKGSDTYVVDNVGDIVTEASGEGTDTVRSSISYTLTANVENLVLLATGPSLNIDGTGNNLDNTITGNIGNNTLDGGLGSDHLNGGAGNDTYIVNTTGDVLTDASGIDTVIAGLSYTLKAGFENLTASGTGDFALIGNTQNNILTGNSGNNAMDGGTGNDTLSGNDGTDVLLGHTGNDILFGGNGDDSLDGGVGIDTMTGGIGNDSYFVDNYYDVINENAGEGTDSLTVTVNNYHMAPTSSIENITLGSTVTSFFASDTDNTITGNARNNVIHAGDGNDTIHGGLGADQLYGEGGADTFVFDAGTTGAADTIQFFSVVEHDVLDLSALLTAYSAANESTSPLSSFLRILDSGANSIVQIDADGVANGQHWTTIATLTHINGLTNEIQLVADGNLIV